MMDYAASLKYLYGLGNEMLAMKLGLESIRVLLDQLDRPEERFPSVIVAGTNGKGSIAAQLERIARRAGLVTGLYTSPHLVLVEERVRIDGANVRGDRFAELATRVRAAAERVVAEGRLPALPTFFEQLTAIAFLEFAARRVDLAVLEVGMGGRLDATNIVKPLVAAISPISLDHQEYLGTTLAEIAAEKAAVVKPGVAAILAHQPPEALEVLMRRCLECEVLPTFTGDAVVHHSEGGRFTFRYETDADLYERVSLGLRGRHQIENALVAIHAAEALRRSGLGISRAAIVDGLARAEWPGRLEVVPGSPPILLDGAHNAAGARALRLYLDEFCHHPVTLVFGVLGDKEVDRMAAELFPAASAVILTRSPSPRAADPADLAGRLAGIAGAAPAVAGTLEKALARAQRVTPRDGVICVAGSLYLVGEARALLAGRAPAAPAGRRP